MTRMLEQFVILGKKTYSFKCVFHPVKIMRSVVHAINGFHHI